jgi:peptidoglycan/xylan/chitin deacetylase (PgdA/CDA1 family)
MKPFVTGILVALLLLSGGCGADPPQQAPAPAVPAREPVVVPAKASAKDVQANELGQIPVLMYHRLSAAPKSVYDRTPEDFRAELESLASQGYVPITAADLATRHIDLPAGKHPVVLTFDDGDPSTLHLTAAGEPADLTAVSILLQVARAHPGFTPVASMYVNENPFGDGPRALTWLRGHGFEVGNHTREHTDLRSVTADVAQSAIADEDRIIRGALPGYAPATLALPYGSHPRTKELSLRGQGYDYAAALLVGANPAPSPYSPKYDPVSVPRIRSQGPDGKDATYGSTVWLDKLARTPGLRYTSDGDPAILSYPSDAGPPAAEFAASARPY